MNLDWSVNGLVSRGEIDQSWVDALRPVEPTLEALAGELAQVPFLPAADAVFRALGLPLPDVRVVILAQDPYPTPGHAMGLAFSVAPHVYPLPRSLRNIFLELHEDVGVTVPSTGDLSAWANRGVLLLNRTLTVEPGKPLAHASRDWGIVTDAILGGLVERDVPLVALLWGREAVRSGERLDGHPFIRCIESAHPSPLSASRGFFGSRPFSRANEALRELGAQPLDWSLP